MAAGSTALARQTPPAGEIRPPDFVPDRPPAPPIPRKITNARWLTPARPVFPAEAAALGVAEGMARLRCTAATSGVLENCVVVSETPAGAGFGAAALAATSEARVVPRFVDGEPDPSILSFNVHFRR